MDYNDILTPIDMYRNGLKEKYALYSEITFDVLVKRSGIDKIANAKQMKVIRKLEKKLAKLNSRLSNLKFCYVLLILFAIIGLSLGTMCLFYYWGIFDFNVSVPVGVSGSVVGILALFLILGPLDQKIQKMKMLAEENNQELQAYIDTGWKMMEPLNKLFRWDTVADLVMKTLPIMVIDRYVSTLRLQQLQEHFHWKADSPDNTSVLACQSGTINGNPWIMVEELHQEWTLETYTGSMEISWREKESYTDANGNQKTRWVTRSQRLCASIQKPIPAYKRNKRIIYGNEAAPELNFSRVPNPLSQSDGGFLDNIKMQMAISDLEKMSRDLSTSFTIMDNREFDACFNAVNRDNEQQFRLLFTPMAQQEMLKLLRDTDQGYGDDFSFTKCGMINILSSEHMDQLDISASPANFQHYGFDTIREKFISYSNEFFRSFFFSFAPLLCIPIYQQHRNFSDIYQGIIDSGEAAFIEQESFVNAIEDQHFRPDGAITRCILKTDVLARSGEDVRVAVTAHAFYGEERIEYVSTYGNDGRYHNVPVPWVEYFPVSRTSELGICPAKNGDHLEVNRQFNSEEWEERLRALDIRMGYGFFRRGLVAFIRQG